MVVRCARKIVLGLCLTAMSILILMGLGALVPRPIAVSANSDANSTASVPIRRVLVLSNPIHTDIAVPADPDVLRAFSFISDAGFELDSPGVFWVVFGWGGRSFYIETPTWADLKPGPVFDALTWDRSVMHIRRTGDIQADLDGVRALDLNNEEFGRLLEGIGQSFQPGDSGTPEIIQGAAYSAHDIFFPAKGGFNALLGCNTWTAQILREAGLQTGLWTPLPATLTWSLDFHNGR